MNNNCLYRSSIFLIILACTEDERAPIFGNPLPNPPGLTNELNLQSDSGDALDYVTLTWNNLGDAELIDHSSIPPNQITPSGNSYVFSGMQPGEFRDISIQLSITADSTYVDSIQIYTRNVHPVTTFTYTIEPRWEEDGNWDADENYEDGNDSYDEGEDYEDGNGVYDEGENFVDSDNGTWDPWEEYEDGNGVYDEGENFVDSDNGTWDPWEEYEDSDNGTWDPWEEYEDGVQVYDRILRWSTTDWSTTDKENFSKYFIYRATNAEDLITPEICNCQIATLSSYSVNSYIDTDPLILGESDEKAFYYLVQVSTGEFTRNSVIDNYLDDSSPVGPITEVTVSTDKAELIYITWNPNPILNTDYFYQYEIRRALGNDTLLVATIPNVGINHFMDRGDEFIDGTTYYYSVVVVDISGRRQESIFKKGFSNPWG